MDPVESTWRWKRWSVTGPEDAISNTLSNLDANLPSGWRRLAGNELVPFGSLVRPGSAWYGLAPDPSRGTIAVSVERPAPSQLRGGWVRSSVRHCLADSNDVLTPVGEAGPFLDEGVIPRGKAVWDEVGRFLDEGVVPAAREAGVVIRVPPPEAAPFSKQPFEVEEGLRRFLDAECKSLPLDRKAAESWRDFVVAVFRMKAIIDAQPFINWLVATGWPMESAAALYSQLGDDCLLLARYADEVSAA